MFERKRSGNSSFGGSTASAGVALRRRWRWRHVELGRVDRLLRRRWWRRWRRWQFDDLRLGWFRLRFAIADERGRTEGGGRELLVAVQHVACRLLAARHDEVAGNKSEEDEKAATDQLVASDGAVGDDRIVGLSQRFEFGRALHQLPLLRRFVAFVSSTGPRIPGSGAPKSGFLRLKMQIHWSPSRSVNWVAVPSTTMYSPSLRKFFSVSEKSH